MFNDIECMSRFAQMKILDSVKNMISISSLKLQDHDAHTRQLVARHREINILDVDEDFHQWIKGKRHFLSLGDLSSIYAALCQKNTIIILSEEDLYIEAEAIKHNVSCITVDTFVTDIINDERAKLLYQLIKTA